jgi:hypothetical protein
MSIYVSNENEGMGYVCYEHEEDDHLPSDYRRAVAQFWVKDGPCKKVWFTTKKSFYENMKMYVGSALVEYTELHKAKAMMGHDFIQYYENNIMQ